MNTPALHKHYAHLQRRRKRWQSGQALPLGLAFILVGMLGALVLFNTGQVAVDKQRLANAADSAAYSGMVWQARALNFQAYTNRAMVANQVSIGQAVSLYSWADYAEQTGDNAEDVFGWIPYVGQFVSIMATVIRVIANITRPVAEGMIAVIGPINEAVGVAQQAMYASSFAATPDIVRDVAKASDSRFTADTAYTLLGFQQNLSGWQDFTQQYTPNEHVTDMRERTLLVNDSRYDFSKARYWDFFDSFWVYSTPFTKHKIFREGETRLVMKVDDGEPQWEWMAKDTAALHTKIWRGWRGTKNVEVPMGWGAAYANNSRDDDSMVLDMCKSYRASQTESCRYRNRNRTTERSYANPNAESLDSYTGIRAFRSISETVRNPQEGEAVLKLKTEMSMDITDVQSSDRYITNHEAYSTPMVSPAEKLSSISVAEVYYRRPEAYALPAGRQADKKRFEPANGYNPYWDVRLAPVDATDRLAALGLRGDTGSSSTLPGGAAAEALANYEAPEGQQGSDEDSGNDQPGGSVLSDYEGASLASVMGVPESELSALVASAPDSLDVSSIAGYLGADEIEDQIKTAIEEKVKDAALEILTKGLESAANQAVPGVVDDVRDIKDAADTAIDLAEGLSEQFETLREQVQAEFQAAMVAQVATYEEDLIPIYDELRALRPLLTEAQRKIDGYSEFSDVPGHLITERDNLARDIEGYQDDARGLYSALRDRLTNYLIDRIEYHGRGLFDERMPFKEMRDVTTFLLEDYLEKPVDERGEIDVNERLPWGEDDDV